MTAVEIIASRIIIVSKLIWPSSCSSNPEFLHTCLEYKPRRRGPG